MPQERNYSFSNHAATVSPTHVIYADTEALLVPQANGTINHVPIAAAFLIVGSYFNTYHHFVGEECIKNMLKGVEEATVQIEEWNNRNTRQKMLPLSAAQLTAYNSANTCYLCHSPSDNLVKDHDHTNGFYF